MNNSNKAYTRCLKSCYINSCDIKNSNNYNNKCNYS